MDDLFYSNANEFFDSGALREVYRCDSFSICNIANVGYFVCLLGTLKNNTPVTGLLVHKDAAKAIVENNDDVYKLFQEAGKKTRNQFICLRDEFFPACLRSYNLSIEKNIITSNVDLEWEQNLLENQAAL